MAKLVSIDNDGSDTGGQLNIKGKKTPLKFSSIQ
jgi:hypothetical protein